MNAYDLGRLDALIFYGVKRAALADNTNQDYVVPQRKSVTRVPDAGTGPSTTGAVLGGERQKEEAV